MIKTLVVVLSFLFFSTPLLADWGVAFSSGQGVLGIKPYRFALSYDFGPVWRVDKIWGLNVFLENSIGYWDGPELPELAEKDCTHKMQAVTSGPMLRWQRWEPLTSAHIIPYAELGVGLSWLSETEMQGRILSLHFQFEDKFGLGMRFGQNQQYDLAFRAYHYSNASIKRPNSGVNLFMASFGYWFPN